MAALGEVRRVDAKFGRGCRQGREGDPARLSSDRPLDHEQRTATDSTVAQVRLLKGTTILGPSPGVLRAGGGWGLCRWLRRGVRSGSIQAGG